MDYYLFRILDERALKQIEHELVKKGLKHPFVIEDDATGEVFLGGQSTKAIKTQNALLVEKKKAEVDWHNQWSLFAENFNEGKAQIKLGEKTLLLLPGPGFGNLSHETTHLMLEMMKQHVEKESIVDIGTGSGILALAALLLNAKSAIGIDIDKAALKHAKENGKLNQLKATFSKTLPKKLSTQNVFLMNMIFPEQKEFKPERFNALAKKWIVSGILEEQKKNYLAQAKKWGWKLLSEHKKGEWLGFVFTILPSHS
jgi:ribosomal protein L11 methyltransferase